jgi:hypothetical protein
VAGNGEGSQGNCNAGEFCYADMICSKQCSKDGLNRLPAGDGTTQGNCLSNQICQTTGMCLSTFLLLNRVVETRYFHIGGLKTVKLFYWRILKMSPNTWFPKFIIVPKESQDEEVEVEEEDDEIPPAAAAVVALVAFAAIAPPPLAMFPPQGLPQPSASGQGGGGGGALPAAVTLVRNKTHH